jgi:hypothetical protein
MSLLSSLQAPVFLLFLDCVWQLTKQFPSAFEFSEFFLLRLYDMVFDCLYNNFLYNSTKSRLQASLHSRRSCFFGIGDEPLDMMDDYEGPLFSAWGRWREDMSVEESEQCLNPLYYVFGSGDTDYDNTTSSTPLSSQFGSILTDSTSLSDTSKFGRYSAEREATPISVASQDIDYYRQGLLIPETSLCSLKVWNGFFFRFLPGMSACHRQELSEVQLLETRMVKDVQKLKEELNEIELSLGAYTTDLTSCIGEVELAREREIMDERRESVEVGMPLRPRLTASVYSYSAIECLEEALGEGRQRAGEEGVDGLAQDDTATPVNSPHSTPTKHQLEQSHNETTPTKHQLVEPLKLSRGGSISSGGIPLPQSPTSLAHGGIGFGGGEAGKGSSKQTSLAQFTDALYSSEMVGGGGLRPKTLAEMTVPSGLNAGSSRSPVTKTRLRVVKSQAADPVVAAWQQSSRPVVKLRETQTDKNSSLAENRVTVASDSHFTKL